MGVDPGADAIAIGAHTDSSDLVFAVALGEQSAEAVVEFCGGPSGPLSAANGRPICSGFTCLNTHKYFCVAHQT